jgi:hypothetical protein
VQETSQQPSTRRQLRCLTVVGLTPSSSAFDQAVTVGVAASFEPDNQAAFYDIYFPKEFAGRRSPSYSRTTRFS